MPDPQPIVFETAPSERRSVFGNFSPPSAVRPGPVDQPATAPVPDECADLALARSFLYQCLARAFDYPTRETWVWLCEATTQDALRSAVRVVAPDPQSSPARSLETLLASMDPEAFGAFHDDIIAAIGHAARGSCPINEIEYGDLKADPLFQPHRLADLGAFYRAFGLELGETADERHDHLSVELEFMAVLTAQEAHARNTSNREDALAVCRDAQRKFLRDHLGRWTPAFARRLHRAIGDGTLRRLAWFVHALIEDECRRLDAPIGSRDLFLRPADEAVSVCDGCGIREP